MISDFLVDKVIPPGGRLNGYGDDVLLGKCRRVAFGEGTVVSSVDSLYHQ